MQELLKQLGLAAALTVAMTANSLRAQNEVARDQIAALTSRAALQRRLKEGYLKMVPIGEHNIVRLTIPAANSENAIQPVSNPQIAR